MSVARDVRTVRRRAARERQSLGDALYGIYLVVLFCAYPLFALGQATAPSPGPLRSAFAAAEPRVLAAVAVIVLVARSAAAARGGPVVLPPEDARLLLTWPVPRRALVLPALLAAVVRALAVAAFVSAALLYVDLRDLERRGTVVRDDLLLPALVAVVTVLVAWQVQGSRQLARVARLLGSLTGLAALGAGCWFGRSLVRDGYVGALRDIGDLGPGRSFSGLAILVLVGLLGPLVALAWWTAGRVSPEQLLARSRRADVTRTGLRLGFTSSVYLSRTEPLRRARRRRVALPRRPGSTYALAGKAFVQEQGTPVLPRVLACAAVSGFTLAAAQRVTPGATRNDLQVPMVWAALAGAALAAVATRLADPVRLDVDRAPLVAAVPLRHLEVIRVDLAVSAGLALLGTVLGAVTIVLLGLAPATSLPGLLFACIGLSVLLAGAGALGALSDDPSPFLPPALSIGYRTSGVIAVLVAVLGSAALLRAPGAATDRLPTAGFVLLLVGAIAAALAVWRGSQALTRGR